MPTINENFLKLEKNYLFINIAKKVNAFMAENPDAPLKELGEYLDPPVGKSGVNHRLRKLSELAERIRT